MQPSPTQADRIFRFGAFELSEREGELRRDGIRIKLQEQPFRVLLELVRSAGKMVTRDELQQKLWPADTFVDFDTGLNTAIRKIRQALGDDANRPTYIETTPKRGYRLLVPVTDSGKSEEIERRMAEVVAIQAEATILWWKRGRVIAGVSLLLAIVGIGIAAMFWPRAAKVERKITWNPENTPVLAAIISPDGKYVAYCDNTGTYFREIDTGETRRLATPPGSATWYPVSWYPDSTHVVLTWRWLNGPEREPVSPKTSGIWRTSILGDAAQQIVEDGSGGVVSPDGHKIAFIRGNALEARQLVIAESDGSKPEEVLTPPSSLVLGELAWSPHGKRLAYQKVYGGGPNNWALETIEVRTHATTVLKTGTRFTSAVWWNRDGRLLYGWKASDTRNAGVYAVPVNEDSGEPEGKEEPVAMPGGSVGWLSVGGSGKLSRLAIVRYVSGIQAYVTEFDPATRRLQAPLRRVTLDQNDSFSTTWTPDSRAIVFGSNRTGEYKLYRQDVNQGVAKLIADGDRVGTVRMTPDSKHFLYIAMTDTEHNVPSALVEVPVEGGPTRTILTRPWLLDVQCAHAPATLCLSVEYAPDQAVFSLNPETGETHPFPQARVHDFLAWGLSPDGKTIAFVQNQSKLTFQSLQDNMLHTLDLSGWGEICGADWDLDSKSIFIGVTQNDGSSALLRVTQKGVKDVLLKNQGFPTIYYAIPAPDGIHLLVGEVTGESNVWMLENF